MVSPRPQERWLVWGRRVDRGTQEPHSLTSGRRIHRRTAQVYSTPGQRVVGSIPLRFPLVVMAPGGQKSSSKAYGKYLNLGTCTADDANTMRRRPDFV